MNKSEINIGFQEVRSLLKDILLQFDFESDKAAILSDIFAENSFSGKESHGLNRFPAFINDIKKGNINVDTEPKKVKSFQAIEQWDGNFGAGPLNAVICTDRAMKLADQFGIGCVALKNTNHWMRGGSYGLRAARSGYIFIGFSNTKPNMAAWGSNENRVGNNPLVIAVPGMDKPIVLDMAMTQYSYGKLEVMARKGQTLPTPGGYDKDGELTNKPSEILETQHPLPTGLWKGTGLALVLDLMAALLSGGLSTHEIGRHSDEKGLSQIFIAISPRYLENDEGIKRVVESIINDYRQSKTKGMEPVYYPGEQSMVHFEVNIDKYMSINRDLWEEIKKNK